MIQIVFRGIIIIATVVAVPIAGAAIIGAPPRNATPEPIRVVVSPASEVIDQDTDMPVKNEIKDNELYIDSGKLLDGAAFIDNSLKTN